MSTRTRVWLFVFCLLGLGASAVSSVVHYRMLADPAYASFCDISETVSCEAVYESAYGTVRAPPWTPGRSVLTARSELMYFLWRPTAFLPSTA